MIDRRSILHSALLAPFARLLGLTTQPEAPLLFEAGIRQLPRRGPGRDVVARLTPSEAARLAERLTDCIRKRLMEAADRGQVVHLSTTVGLHEYVDAGWLVYSPDGSFSLEFRIEREGGG